MRIPLTKPYWGKEEKNVAVSAIRNGVGAGDGPWSKKLVKRLSELTRARFVYPVSSCTHGLELAMAVLGVKSGDEVIVPSFTLSATANCVVSRGAKPVFADINERTYNIDPYKIEKLITGKTKGVIVVHYAGISVDLEKIAKLVNGHKLFLIEDAAHAVGSLYKGGMLGTFGDIGVYSFHITKNICCGEGGALITNRADLTENIEIYRNNGTNRSAFLKGLVDRYSWIGEGSSFLLSDILAGIVYTQLDKLKAIMERREKIAQYYDEFFSDYKTLIQLPTVPKDTIPNWHIYAIRFYKPEHQKIFIKKMRQKGIEVSSHFVPLHSSPMGKRFRGRQDLSVTDLVSRTLVRLPIYPSLTKKEVAFIISTAKKILTNLYK